NASKCNSLLSTSDNRRQREPNELRSWEEALARAAEEQREQEEHLRRREQELAEREIDIVERELNIIIHQMYQEKPHVKKRKGHFKKSRLLKLGRDSNCISLPSGFEHKITVQASPSVDKRKGQGSESTTPPASPGVMPRLRAIRLTPSDGRKTWGRTAVCKKEDLGTKKKGRTWGPSSTHQRERVGGEDKLKSLGEGKVLSSSAPNLGKSPKHAPMTAGFSSLNEMGESESYSAYRHIMNLQDEQDLREEQRKKKEGLFQCTGRFRRSTSPPSRTLSLSLSHNRHQDSSLPRMDPSPSVTLLSLSYLSDCNSTKSLLPSDPDDFAPNPSSAHPVVSPAVSLNPLLDLRAESFKREPNQSLTPTHVSAAMALNRGHRRTPSDGAIRPRSFMSFICSPPGSHETLDIPRLPDPSMVYPSANRHSQTGTLERPKTLEFAPRPRPTPARARPDPWKLSSLSQTLSSSPGSSCDSPLGSSDSGVSAGAGVVHKNLLDMDMEGQSQDNTVPLCGQHQKATLCGQHFS
uniref:Mitogen-activated protein kinase kinase kinase 10 n=1 Tax=Sinocyclocheilus anshuiensis TaxID=1608454 RepID=A0A671PY52_9TELE